MKPGHLEDRIETVLTAGLVVSASLLVIGLSFASSTALQWGLVILMLTPVARVVTMTLGLLHGRDYVFGAVSLVILTVLASSFYTAARLHSARTPPPPVRGAAPRSP